MPSFTSTSPKLSVDDVIAFSDAKLVQYMVEKRRPGGFELDNVEGWEKLPKDKREELAERLRTGAAKASEAIRSRPVDFDQVTARLLDISADSSTSPRARPQVVKRHPYYGTEWYLNIIAEGREPLPDERPPTTEELAKKHDEESKKYETENYKWLIEEGGRPFYPIDLIEGVSKNPEEYREMLRPGLKCLNLKYTPNWRDVFERQLDRWRDFRKWQQDMRGAYNYDAEFSVHVEQYKCWYELIGCPGEMEDLSKAKKHFDSVEGRRRREQHGLLEVEGDGGFPAYVEAVKQRLAGHGFAPAFQLEEDPARQDKFVTWIEYLNYEYCWYDLHTRTVQHLQPKYDEAWKHLVDSGVLRPGETDESVRTDESAMRCQNEEDAAAKAVQSAKSAAQAALISRQKARNNPQDSSLKPQDCVQMMKAAHTRLDKAKASLELIKRRGDFITEFIRGTWDYQGAKEDVERHSILLRWILEQIPLIEAELNEFKAANGGSQARHDARPRRDHDDEVTQDRRRTTQKRGDYNSSLSDGISSPARAKGRLKRGRRDEITDVERPLKRSRTDAAWIGVPAASAQKQRSVQSKEVPQSPAIFQQLRRSDRIAARQDPSKITMSSVHAVKNPSQKPRRKIAQAPMSPPRTRSQDHQLKSLTTKASKGRAITQGDWLGRLRPKGVSKKRRSQ